MIDFSLAQKQLAALTDGCRPLSALSNAAAFIYSLLPDVSWVGFYLTDESGEKLLLGPFQGKTACTEIPFGKGVCGTAAQRKESVLVKDVHLFPGHIACDSGSRSELVIPLTDGGGRVLGVLDLDSYSEGRFTEEDREGLETLGRVIAGIPGIGRIVM